MADEKHEKDIEEKRSASDAGDKTIQKDAKKPVQQDEEELEEGLEESFPGSDAPSSTMRHEK